MRCSLYFHYILIKYFINKMVQAGQSFLNELLQHKGQKKSYILMILSSIFWVSGYIFGNQHNFTPIETNLSRSIVMVVGVYAICRKMGLDIQYRSPKSWRVLLIRHFCFVIQGFTLASVQFVLPLGITHTIASTGPILTLVLQTLFFKKEFIHGRKLKGCVLAVVGILLASNGKYIYAFIDKSFQFKSDFGNYLSSSHLVIISATVLLLLSMIIWAYGVLITQQAECHSFVIIFHFAVTNLLISSVTYLLLPEKRPASQIYESLIWTGILLLLAEITFTFSLNLSQNIGLTNVSGFVIVVMGYCISIFRYGQSIQIVSLSGTFLVVFGVSLVILTKQLPVQQQGRCMQQEVLKKQEEICDQ